MISGGLDVASQHRLREVQRMLDDLPSDPALRRRITVALAEPAQAVVRDMQAAIMALSPAPREWKEAGRDLVRAEVRLAGPDPNIAVSLPKTPAARGPWLLDQGSWRHPLFGNRSHWYEQRVTPGWFDETARRAHPGFIAAATAGLEAAAEELADRIEALNRF